MTKSACFRATNTDNKFIIELSYSWKSSLPSC